MRTILLYMFRRVVGITRIKANAWDDGYAAGQTDYEHTRTNPYREDNDVDDHLLRDAPHPRRSGTAVGAVGSAGAGAPRQPARPP